MYVDFLDAFFYISVGSPSLDIIVFLIWNVIDSFLSMMISVTKLVVLKSFNNSE